MLDCLPWKNIPCSSLTVWITVVMFSLLETKVVSFLSFTEEAWLCYFILSWFAWLFIYVFLYTKYMSFLLWLMFWDVQPLFILVCYLIQEYLNIVEWNEWNYETATSRWTGPNLVIVTAWPSVWKSFASIALKSCLKYTVRAFQPYRLLKKKKKKKI